MSFLLNLCYLLVLLLISPWLVYKALTTGKYRQGLWRKLIGQALLREGDQPAVWFHGVSVGEIHLLRQVVAGFQKRHPDWQCVVSTTTDTGLAEACKCFPHFAVFYWPLDFTWAVHRALRRVKPSLVVVAEGELWPNFLAAAKQRGIPVAVINGRLSPRSFRRLRQFRFLARTMLSHVDLFAVQTEEYAASFRDLGVSNHRMVVTGSVKFDGVETDRQNPRTRELAGLLLTGGPKPIKENLIWIAGSTQEAEEKIVVDIYRRAIADHPGLRLFLVPRQRERFEEVARMLAASGLPFLRRSRLKEGPAVNGSTHPPIILVDTIGELSALWGLADVAFVGGSLDGRRGGQNMIEPAAYGAAVVFGPHVWNFQDTADRLAQAGGAIQVQDAADLEKVTRRLLADAAERQRLGQAARHFVLQQQGATEQTISLLETLFSEQLGLQDVA
jgi:3-deoxy-D-manno-octulosonic-acid transferase